MSTGLAAGVPALFASLLVIEAGVPLPVPGDLLMFLVGERAAAGAVPLWAAILLLEVVALVGTTALLLAARGPARALIARLGPRIGLTDQRMARTTRIIEGRGRVVVAVGRATPGLRTLTVLTTAASHLRIGVALPLLVIGSSVFLQVHLALGYALGPLADDALGKARLPTAIVLAALALGGLGVWLARRGRRTGAAAWAEASCPVCLGLGAVAARALDGGLGVEVGAATP